MIRLTTLFLAASFFISWHSDLFAADSEKPAPRIKDGTGSADSKQGKVGNIRKGNEIYHERCAMCHGMDGNPILPMTPNFAKRERMEKSDEELLGTIQHGKDLMPPWKEMLSEEERKDVLSYIRVIVGDKVFEEKCLRCHTRSQGAYTIPSDIPWGDALKDFTGPLDICKACNIESELTREELLAVIQYIRALGTLGTLER